MATALSLSESRMDDPVLMEEHHSISSDPMECGEGERRDTMDTSGFLPSTPPTKKVQLALHHNCNRIM